jgi:hypothetical protein
VGKMVGDWFLKRQVSPCRLRRDHFPRKVDHCGSRKESLLGKGTRAGTVPNDQLRSTLGRHLFGVGSKQFRLTFQLFPTFHRPSLICQPGTLWLFTEVNNNGRAKFRFTSGKAFPAFHEYVMRFFRERRMVDVNSYSQVNRKHFTKNRQVEWSICR